MRLAHSQIERSQLAGASPVEGKLRDNAHIDCGVLGPPIPAALDRKIAAGTRNFACEAAM
jgi:hypothetical protein